MSATIREFQTSDSVAFRALNEEWIMRYFVLEEQDRKVFDDPQATIVGKGGRIFLAELDGKAVGCCALLAIAPNEYEIAKMAVTPSAQGSGIGRRLLAHVIAAAQAMGATRLYLETNHALTPAIRLYKALGFRNAAAERITPSYYARVDVCMELFLA